MGVKKQKHCKICSSNIPEDRRNCCSEECMMELARKRARDRQKRMFIPKSGYDHICEICGSNFHDHTPLSKACSDSCRQKYRRQYARNYCSHPDNIERYREQVRMGNRKRRLRPEVKEEEKIKHRIWCKNNPEKVKEMKRKSDLRNPESVQRRRHRRKAVVKGGGIYPKEGVIRYRMNIFGNCCYCKSGHALTLEHLIPLSKEGHNGVCNLLGACLTCNTSKNNRDWQDWYRKQTFYDLRREKSIILACNQ